MYGHSWVDANSDDPTRGLVHHNQGPMRFESKGLTTKEIDTPETVFHLTDEGQP